MNREEFNKAIFAEFDKYKQKITGNGIEYVFNSAYEINKMQSLRDALTNMEESLVEDLYPYAKNILDNLYTFEFEYDIPMFMEWDDVATMISDYIRSQHQAERARKAAENAVQ